MSVKVSWACMGCGKRVDGQAGIGEGVDADAIPTEGAVSICIYCSQICFFTPDGPKLPSHEEYRELLSDMDIIRALAALIQLRNGDDWKAKEGKETPEPRGDQTADADE